MRERWFDEGNENDKRSFAGEDGFSSESNDTVQETSGDDAGAIDPDTAAEAFLRREQETAADDAVSVMNASQDEAGIAFSENEGDIGEPAVSPAAEETNGTYYSKYDSLRENPVKPELRFGEHAGYESAPNTGYRQPYVPPRNPEPGPSKKKMAGWKKALLIALGALGACGMVFLMSVGIRSLMSDGKKTDGTKNGITYEGKINGFSKSSAEEATANEENADDAEQDELKKEKERASLSPDVKPEGEAEVITADGSDDTYLTIPQVVEKVMPAMVSITNTTVTRTQSLFGQSRQVESVSAGSGIIVGKTETDLLIATNEHVVTGSKDITVTFVDDSALPAEIAGKDAENDLAIVTVALSDIPSNTLDAISIVTIGDSSSVKIGESVVAIGNALGYGQSVSSGIISAVNREVTDSEGIKRTLLQTDASINPGNSGGALLNLKGELIGINESKLVDTTVEGVGYAIPMNIAEPILQKLGNKAKRTKADASNAAYMGITCFTMPANYTMAGYPEGVYVDTVDEKGAASKAGLKESDIIVNIDGVSVKSKEDLLEELTYHEAGETVDISFMRLNADKTDFERKTVSITFGKKDSQ